MRTVGFVSVFLILGFLTTWLSKLVGSTFIQIMLQEQLVTIILTLLAINMASTAIILSKLEDLSIRHGRKFSATSNSLKNSLTAQIVLLIIGTILSIINSNQNPSLQFCHDDFIYQSIGTAVLIDTVYVMCDVGYLMFDIYSDLKD